MKQRVINGHALEFFDSANTKKGEIKISGSNIIINPLDANGTVIFGEEGTVNDIEVGAVGTPVDFTFAGGGTITSNGGTLTIGNSGDTIDLSSATIGAITASAFVGGTFEGNGAGLTNVVPDLSAYNGNVSITGSLRVTGRVTAEEFHTEYVSASILYQSGSTKFGDTGDDRHEFTGSINLRTNNQDYYISGSSNVLRIGSKTTANKIQLELYHAANPVSLGIDYNGGQALPYIESVHPSYDTNTHLLFKPGGTENWRIGAHGSDHAYGSAFSIKPANSSLDFYLADSSGTPILYSDTSAGKIGIGTTTPSQRLHVSGNIVAENYYPTVYVNHQGTILGGVRADATTKLEFKTLTTAPLSFQVNSSQKMLITNEGSVGIGTNSPTSRLHIKGSGTTSSTTAFRVENSNGSGSFVVRDDGSVGIGTVSPTSGINLHVAALASNGVEPGNDGRVFVQIGDTSTTSKAQLNFLRYNSVAVGAGYMIPETNSPHLMWSEGGTPNQEWRISLVGTSRPYYEKFYPQSNPPYKEFGFASGSGTTADGIGAFTPSMVMHYGGDIMVGPSRTTPSARLHVSGTADVLLIEGSGSTANTSIFAIDGNNGRLFEVSDDLSDSLFSVNTIAGLPVMEVFSNNRITMGAFNQNDLVISGSKVGIGTATPSDKLHVAGIISGSDINIDGWGSVSASLAAVGGGGAAFPHTGEAIISGSGNTSSTNALNIVNSDGSLLLKVQDDGVVFSNGPSHNASSTVYGEYAGNASAGSDNTIFGFGAGQNYQGATSTLIGRGAGQNLNSTSYNTVMIGYEAGRNATADSDNAVYVGYSAGYQGDGIHQIGIGTSAAYSSSVDYVVALGYAAGYQSTSPQNSVFIGREAGYDQFQGAGEVMIGYRAGQYAITNSDNVMIGTLAGQNTTGYTRESVFIGDRAGQNNTGMISSVAIGNYAGGNADGNYSVLIGPSAGWSSLANENVAIGYNTLAYSTTTGFQNVALGTDSMYIVSSSKNVAIGYKAASLGETNSSYGLNGTNNTFLGANTNYSSANLTITNATAVGANTIVTDSNTVILGNNANVGIGTSSPQETFHVSGSVRIDGAGTGAVQEQAGNSPTTALTNGDPDFYMGIPDTYLKIVIDGTTYVIPAYSPA